jgi:hypothetical protein
MLQLILPIFIFFNILKCANSVYSSITCTTVPSVSLAPYAMSGCALPTGGFLIFYYGSAKKPFYSFFEANHTKMNAHDTQVSSNLGSIPKCASMRNETVVFAHSNDSSPIFIVLFNPNTRLFLTGDVLFSSAIKLVSLEMMYRDHYYLFYMDSQTNNSFCQEFQWTTPIGSPVSLPSGIKSV